MSVTDSYLQHETVKRQTLDCSCDLFKWVTRTQSFIYAVEEDSAVLGDHCKSYTLLPLPLILTLKPIKQLMIIGSAKILLNFTKLYTSLSKMTVHQILKLLTHDDGGGDDDNDNDG